MKSIYQEALRALEGKKDAVLVRVLSADGSAPRGAGAALLMFEDGSFTGTVGGGALEAEALRGARAVFSRRADAVKRYPLAQGALGMACGGAARLGWRYLSHEEGETVALLRAIDDCRRREESAWLVEHPEGPEKPRLYRAGDAVPEDARPLLRRRAVYRDGEDPVYAEPVFLRGRVCVYGGGHVGRALTPLLAKVDFRVWMLDDRAEIALNEFFPEAEQVRLVDYGSMDEGVLPDADDCAVVLTHGHQADFEVLRQVLKTPASYVGCIGSRSKAAYVAERLRADGFSEADVARVHSPIGLAIGARTPEEIAVSIAAELIEHRAARSAL